MSSYDRILLKALELFSQKGYDASSVREICQAAGITKPTLYHFYGSKEGVYRAIVDGALEGFKNALADALAAPGTTAARLQRLARAYFDYARQHRELSRFILGLIHNPPSSAPATDFARFYEGIVTLAGHVVEDGVAKLELLPGPLEPRMLVYMGSLAEAMHGYLIAGRPLLTPELADTLVETILAGWTRN